MKYYIDESGNTGDLVMTEDNINFSSQEYFTLACIGLEDESLSDLNEFVEQLKKKYKIQNEELKFGKIKHIFGKKIGFVLELLKYIEENSKILVEIVDKKYIVATNIVNHLINPPYYQPERSIEEEKAIRQELSQWVYEYLPNNFYINFSNISRNPSQEGLEKLFESLVQLLKSKNDELSIAILSAVKESIDDYRLVQEDIQKMEEAYIYFLPLPDKNTKGELIGILPHISCFTNLHARLNHIYSNNLSSVTIIHDNQAHFEHIIDHYHKTAKENFDTQTKFEKANFKFTTLANLEFRDDKNEIGLQIADIFAGFINKAIPYLIKKESYLKDNEFNILIQILAHLQLQPSINYVIAPNIREEIIFPILDDRIRYILDMATIFGISKESIDDELLKKKGAHK